jgi:hypothetical protein
VLLLPFGKGSEVMANATGRPIAPLMLSLEVRGYFERQFAGIELRDLCPNAAETSCDAQTACPAKLL